MTSLSGSLDTDVRVEHGQFYVVAGSSDGMGPIYTGEDDFLQVDGSGILCLSAAGSHLARVRLERWDDEPPATGGEWDLTRTVQLVRGSGPAYVVSLTGGRASGDLPIEGEEGESIYARVLCRGRSTVHRWFADGNTEDPSAGTETWTIQFWPS